MVKKEMVNKMCRLCGKKINWVCEVTIYPTNSNPEIEDFYTETCYACLMDLANNIEVKRRMLDDEKNTKKIVKVDE